MLPCRNPYLRSSGGASVGIFLTDKAARDAVTPFGCGNCLPCRINRSREWTIRILLEACDHENCYFITMTYENEKCDKDDHCTPQLSPLDASSFLKMLREDLNDTFRYFLVGEYGDDTFRPHLHMVYFGNRELDDKKIESVWKKGWCSVDELNQTTARYITGYCVKKLTKEGDEKLYGRKPEFMRSSKGTKQNGLGGLGRNAVRQIAETYKKQTYFRPVIVREFRYGGQLYPLGRYLTRKLAEDCGVSDEAFQAETLKYQTELFLYFTEKVQKEGADYRTKIIESGNGKYNSIVARQAIFKQKRRL